MIKIIRKGEHKKISDNFNSSEFDCHGKGCCSQTLIDTELVEVLQKARDYFGKPLKVSSGYRCDRHNKAVGGASGSKHRYGMAADIKVEGIAPKKVAQFVEGLGVKGIGLYETDRDGYFVHIDTRDTKSFWYGQGEAYRSTFGASNNIRLWQEAAVLDGFSFKSGVNGVWNSDCSSVAEKAICKKRLVYKYRKLTEIVQRKVGAEVDGRFGSATKKAVASWQRSKGLTADGIVGLKTWKAILEV